MVNNKRAIKGACSVKNKGAAGVVNNKGAAVWSITNGQSREHVQSRTKGPPVWSITKGLRRGQHQRGNRREHVQSITKWQPVWSITKGLQRGQHQRGPPHHQYTGTGQQQRGPSIISTLARVNNKGVPRSITKGSQSDQQNTSC